MISFFLVIFGFGWVSRTLCGVVEVICCYVSVVIICGGDGGSDRSIGDRDSNMLICGRKGVESSNT